jgi:hypothetical protein
LGLLLQHGSPFDGLDLGNSCSTVFGCGELADMVEDVDGLVDVESISA